MSRIIGVTLLLIVLVDNFHNSTASHAQFDVSKVHIRKCKCKAFPNGKVKCRFPMLPTSNVENRDWLNCVCSKTNQHKFQAVCATLLPGIPISLA